MAPEKTTIPVIAYTQHHRIEGTLTLLKGEHFSDRMNIVEKKFESLIDARVYALATGQLVHEAPCVAINKEQVSLLVPAEGADLS